MELLRFIQSHADWKSLLAAPPYSLILKEEDGFTLLKYDLLFSDFNQPIVRECRGIILDGGNRVVCCPFFKFFNYGESYADHIDWATARVQEKIDGSIMKLWFYGDRWHLSTNGSIDAYRSHLHDVTLQGQSDDPYLYYGQLFDAAVNRKDLDLDELDKNYTYIFELTSPYAKVVIDYPYTAIWHIGTRDNRTFAELDVDIGVQKPRSYPLRTLDDCVRAAQAMGSDHEGFVVVDAAWHRVKIKNPTYLRMHRMIGNRTITDKEILAILLENEQAEFLSYFGEYTARFAAVEAKLNAYRSRLEATWREIAAHTGTRKQLAEVILATDKANSRFYFMRINDPTYPPEAYWRGLPIERMMEHLGLTE